MSFSPNFLSLFHQAVVGFTLDSKLKRPNCEFDNEKVRFEHRFGHFASVLTPPLVQYEQFCEITDIRKFEQKPSAMDMYYAACKLFMQSSAVLEKIPNPSNEVCKKGLLMFFNADLLIFIRLLGKLNKLP